MLHLRPVGRGPDGALQQRVGNVEHALGLLLVTRLLLHVLGGRHAHAVQPLARVLRHRLLLVERRAEAGERHRLVGDKRGQALPHVIEPTALEPIERKVAAADRRRRAKGQHGRQGLLRRGRRARVLPQMGLDVRLQERHIAAQELGACRRIPLSVALARRLAHAKERVQRPRVRIHPALGHVDQARAEAVRVRRRRDRKPVVGVGLVRGHELAQAILEGDQLDVALANGRAARKVGQRVEVGAHHAHGALDATGPVGAADLHAVENQHAWVVAVGLPLLHHVAGALVHAPDHLVVQAHATLAVGLEHVHVRQRLHLGPRKLVPERYGVHVFRHDDRARRALRIAARLLLLLGLRQVLRLVKRHDYELSSPHRFAQVPVHDVGKRADRANVFGDAHHQDVAVKKDGGAIAFAQRLYHILSDINRFRLSPIRFCLLHTVTYHRIAHRRKLLKVHERRWHLRLQHRLNPRPVAAIALQPHCDRATYSTTPLPHAPHSTPTWTLSDQVSSTPSARRRQP